MIPRYSRLQMTAIWDAQTRYRIWFEIEAHAADAMAALGLIPKQAAQTIWAKGKASMFDIARELEAAKFVNAEEFLDAAKNPELIRDIAPHAKTLEG